SGFLITLEIDEWGSLKSPDLLTAKFKNSDLRMEPFNTPDSYKPNQRLLKLSIQMLLMIKLLPAGVLYKFWERSETVSLSGKYSNNRLLYPNHMSPCSSSSIDSINKVMPVIDLSRSKCFLPVGATRKNLLPSWMQ